MNVTVEDAIEILVGAQPRNVFVRIDQSDYTIIRSISNQISNGIGLTDRQLDMVLKKIKKYRFGLNLNNVNVDLILESKLTRLPIRELDRTQSITVMPGKPKKIHIKYAGNKVFYNTWEELKSLLIGDVTERPQIKEFNFNENNVLNTVSLFKDQNFDIDQEILNFYKTMEEIQENPDKYIPWVDIEGDQIILKNISKTCKEYIDKNFSDLSSKNFLAYINKLKYCGIHQKSSEIIEKIRNFSASEKSKIVTELPASRFRILPTEENFSEVVTMIQELDQWPILIIVDDDARSIGQVKRTIDPILSVVSHTEVSVFFRLDNNIPQGKEFNEFIKNSKLNNFIDSKTKVVIVSKTRIPKPLLRANWKPQAAIVMSNYDFGRSSAYIDNLPAVYYYNNSVSVRHSKIKGPRSIVEL